MRTNFRIFLFAFLLASVLCGYSHAITLIVPSNNVNLVISGTTTLSSDLVCGSLTITGTLVTNGYSVYCNSTINFHSGTINTGINYSSGDAGTPGGGGNAGYGLYIQGSNIIAGTLITSGAGGSTGGANGGGGGGGAGAVLFSYGTGGYTADSGAYTFTGGSGSGSGGSCPACEFNNNGNSGANTKASGGAGGAAGSGNGGSGSTPSNTLCIYTNANIIAMYSTNSMFQYFQGGGGGAGANYGSMSSTLVNIPNSCGGSGAGGGGSDNDGGSSGNGGNGGNGQALTFSYGSNAPIIVLLPLSTATLSASNPKVDSGQNEILTASWTGGESPFTANYINVTGNALLASNANILALSNTYTFTINSASIKTLQYNAIITDSLHTIKNSTPVNVLISPALNVPSISFSNSTLDAGQYEVFNALASGGTSPYTYNFLVYNSLTNALIANQLGTSNIFVWHLPSSIQANTVYAKVIVNDSATVPEFQSADSNNIIIYPAFSLASWRVSNPIIDVGQTQTLTANINGGSPQFTFNIIATANSVIVENSLVTTNSISDALVFIQSALGLNIANVIITDSASKVESLSNSLLYSANSLLTKPQLFPSITEAYDYGQNVIIKANQQGGTAPYTFNFIIANSSTILFNSLQVSNTISWAFPFNDIGLTATGNVIVNDSASVPEFNSSRTGLLRLNEQLGVPTLSIPSNQTFIEGQKIFFTARLPANQLGTSPYAYRFAVYGVATRGSNTILFASISTVASSSGSASLSWNITPQYVGLYLFANVSVTDYALTAITVNSTRFQIYPQIQPAPNTTTTSTTTTIQSTSSSTSPSAAPQVGVVAILLIVVIIVLIAIILLKGKGGDKQWKILTMLTTLMGD